jgi:hypothetical protein
VANLSKQIDRAEARDDVAELVRLAWAYGSNETSFQLASALSAVALRLHEQGRVSDLARILTLPDIEELAPPAALAGDLLASRGPGTAGPVFQSGRYGDNTAKRRAERVLRVVGESEKAAELLRLSEEEDERQRREGMPSEDDPFPPLPGESWWVRRKRLRMRRYFMTPNKLFQGRKPWDVE